MATFKASFGPVNSIEGDTNDFNVTTIADLLRSERVKAALGHPDGVTVSVNNVPVSGDFEITDGAVIRIQKNAGSKG